MRAIQPLLRGLGAAAMPALALGLGEHGPEPLTQPPEESLRRLVNLYVAGIVRHFAIEVVTIGTRRNQIDVHC